LTTKALRDASWPSLTRHTSQNAKGTSVPLSGIVITPLATTVSPSAMSVSTVKSGGSLGPCAIHARSVSLPTMGSSPTIVQTKSSVHRAKKAS
jgi:hypothetical protein